MLDRANCSPCSLVLGIFFERYFEKAFCFSRHLNLAFIHGSSFFLSEYFKKNPCLILPSQVNHESPSEAVGLLAGDVIVAVNGQDITSCRHKEAQDVIVRAGNNFRLTIQR